MNARGLMKKLTKRPKRTLTPLEKIKVGKRNLTICHLQQGKRKEIVLKEGNKFHTRIRYITRGKDGFLGPGGLIRWHVVVPKELQSNHIASKMYHHAITRLKNTGVDSISIDVMPSGKVSSKKMHSILTRHGFESEWEYISLGGGDNPFQDITPVKMGDLFVWRKKHE